MVSPSFTVTGSSLDLLKPGEQGTIKFLRVTNQSIHKKLIAMGLIPGSSILLEQRFPAFVVSVGNTRLALDREIARSIYIRLG